MVVEGDLVAGSSVPHCTSSAYCWVSESSTYYTQFVVWLCLHYIGGVACLNLEARSDKLCLDESA